MTALRAHYLQHVSFEGPGSIGPWLAAQHYETTCTKFFESTHLPAPEEVDLLIVLGGPMSVNDEQVFPWLVQEKAFVRRFIETGKPVLGVCLGAQLIATVAGAKVYPNRTKEIGWFPIQAEPGIDESMFRFPAALEVFHWHGETFDLPAGATRLARSEACENQAFQLGASVIGLQFHLETTSESAQQMLALGRGELCPARFVQSESAILAADPRKYRAVNALMADVLSFLRAAGSARNPAR